MHIHKNQNHATLVLLNRLEIQLFIDTNGLRNATRWLGF